MATYRYPHTSSYPPLALLVPARPAASDHWMSSWDRWSLDSRTVELGLWDEPHRNTWINKLNLAIRRAERPVVVVVEDAACLALAWWVEYEQPSDDCPVIGALLVNPPDVDRPGSDRRLARFGACPRNPLPFPSYLVSSLDDPVARQRTAMQLAEDWDSRLVRDDVFGDWRSGWPLLQALLRTGAAAGDPVLWRGDPLPARHAALLDQADA